MIRVDLDFNIEPKEEAIGVAVNYRCWFSPTKAFYPMDILGEIWPGYSLEEFKQEHKRSYEKDYLKVEIVDVFLLIS